MKIAGNIENTIKKFCQTRKNSIKTTKQMDNKILNKALQGESVIGLLPTGGGKSLTYQLAAIFEQFVRLF